MRSATEAPAAGAGGGEAAMPSPANAPATGAAGGKATQGAALTPAAAPKDEPSSSKKQNEPGKGSKKGSEDPGKGAKKDSEAERTRKEPEAKPEGTRKDSKTKVERRRNDPEDKAEGTRKNPDPKAERTRKDSETKTEGTRENPEPKAGGTTKSSPTKTGGVTSGTPAGKNAPGPKTPAVPPPPPPPLEFASNTGEETGERAATHGKGGMSVTAVLSAAPPPGFCILLDNHEHATSYISANLFHVGLAEEVTSASGRPLVRLRF